MILASMQKANSQSCLTLITIPEYNCATSALELTLSVVNTTIAPPYTVTSSPAGINAVMTTTLITLTNIPYNSAYSFTVYTTTSCFYVGGANYAPPPTSSVNISISNTLVSCYGGANGAASAVNLAGVAPFTYTWSTGSNNSSISGLSVGVYSVSITDGKNCTASREFTITEPAQINSQLSSTFIPCFGSTITSAVTSTGGVAPFSYTVSGTPVATGTNIATNLSAGIQTIVTKDSKLCLITNTILISQANQQLISPLIQQPSCPGKSDGSISVTVSGPYAGYTYTWLPGNSGSTVITAVPAGNYTLSVKDLTNCITNSVFIVPQAPTITPVVGVSKENCSAGDGSFTLTLSGGHPPFTYTTNPGNISAGVGTNLSSGFYTTFITDANACADTLQFYIGNLSTVSLTAIKVNSVECYNTCNGSVLCNVQNAVLPVSYSITGFPTSTLNLLTNLCAGNYIVYAIDAIGCPATDTINFATPPVFSYSAVPPPVICIGKQANLIGLAQGGSGSHTYIWNPGNFYGSNVAVSPSVTTVFNLNVYDSKNCTLAPFQVTVNVNPPLSININSSNSGVCPGTTAQITPTVNGGDGNYSYLWLPGGSKGASIFVANLSIPTYSFFVVDACGSPPVFKEITLNLFPVIRPTYLSKDSLGCLPLCTEFVNTTPGSKNAIWNFGDKPFEKIGETTNYCYDKAGTYNLKLSITDSNSCKTSFTYSNAIYVLEKPKADYFTNPSTITTTNAEQVKFHNLSDNASEFKWYVNNELIGTDFDVHYSFPDTGSYDIKLSVKNTNQCSDSTIRSLRVFEGFTFYMPQAFSPNADGLNDVLQPKGIAWLIEGYRFEVFNKWGHRIFFTNNVYDAWDGGINAPYFDPALSTAYPNDVYTWKIEISDNMQEKHVYTGYVTLLR